MCRSPNYPERSMARPHSKYQDSSISFRAYFAEDDRAIAGVGHDMARGRETSSGKRVDARAARAFGKDRDMASGNCSPV